MDDQGRYGELDKGRYGELTDEPEQMSSPEGVVREGAIVACGRYMADLIKEMRRYLVTRN